ncbi:MAG: tail fiber protein [Bacteroidales bacterium]|nr:tail fiber protein [Bacteroidales bacterium]
MDSDFIGEIRAFPYNFVPYGWVECNGQALQVNEFSALFSVIGLYYGGNGNPLFNVPDLRGAAAIGFGQKPGHSFYQLGERAGEETVGLNASKIPSHNHTFNGGTGDPASRESAPGTDNQSYLTNVVYEQTGTTTPRAASAFCEQPGSSVNLNSATLTPAWGNAQGAAIPHENRSPFVAIRYCICWDGIYPVSQ